MTDEEIQTRITEILALITETETEISAIIAGGHERYDLDTGQSTQIVRRLPIKDLSEYKKTLQLELTNLRNLIGGPDLVVFGY